MHKYMVLISGKTGTGKTASLRNIRDQKGLWYLNFDAGKDLPFKNEFVTAVMDDPKEIATVLEKAEKSPTCHTVVIDTLSMALTMFVNRHVLTADNVQKEWGEYARWFQNLMNGPVAKSTKNLIFLTHTTNVTNEDRITEIVAAAPGKRLNLEGIEAFFTTVVSTKKLPIGELTGHDNPHLNITETEKKRGVKHVYQTDVIGDTNNERMKSGGMSIWSFEETFIDNDLQIVIDRLRQ